MSCLPRAVDHASVHLYLSRLLRWQLSITTPNWAFYKNIQFLYICQKQFFSLYKLNYIEILTLYVTCGAIFCRGTIRWNTTNAYSAMLRKKMVQYVIQIVLSMSQCVYIVCSYITLHQFLLFITMTVIKLSKTF